MQIIQKSWAMRHGSDWSLLTCRIYHLVIPFSSTSVGWDWNPLPESLPGHWKTFSSQSLCGWLVLQKNYPSRLMRIIRRQFWMYSPKKKYLMRSGLKLLKLLQKNSHAAWQRRWSMSWLQDFAVYWSTTRTPLGLLRAISVYAFWLLRIKTRRKTCTI